MRSLIYRVLTNRTGYHTVCLAMFIPLMLGFKLASHWVMNNFGVGVFVAVFLPLILAAYLVLRALGVD